jgi:branched-chain amino acid transport system substrate-binding protein
VKRRLWLAALAIAAAAATSAFGQQDSALHQRTLTIHASLPLQGPKRRSAIDTAAGMRMALAEAGGRTGRFRIAFRLHDDATAQERAWDPGAESRNARRAAQDQRAIAYIGAFDSGASAISIPILNEARLLQVSPANGLVGLTRDEPGAEPGEPDKYYPRGSATRNYIRVVPRDTVQAAALAALVGRNCARVYIVRGRFAYSRGMAVGMRRSARERGIPVVGFARARHRTGHDRRLVRRVKEARPDCVAVTSTAENAVRLFRNIGRTVPRAKLFGTRTLADRRFTDPERGGLDPRIARRVRLTREVMGPRAYPDEGQRFFERFHILYARRPDPYAIYGYEAMSLVLSAIAAAGDQGDDRSAVIDAAFATTSRPSVLGPYSIDRNGDTTRTEYGVYRITSGRLRFTGTIRP